MLDEPKVSLAPTLTLNVKGCLLQLQSLTHTHDACSEARVCTQLHQSAHGKNDLTISRRHFAVTVSDKWDPRAPDDDGPACVMKVMSAQGVTLNGVVNTTTRVSCASSDYSAHQLTID